MAKTSARKVVKTKSPKVAINRAAAGSSKTIRGRYGQAELRRQKNTEVAERSARVHQLSRAERLELHRLRDAPPPIPPMDDLPDEMGDVSMMDEVLGGRERMQFSHEGGEFSEVLQSLTAEYLERQSSKPSRRRDYRTRRDRTQRRIDRFRPQMPSLVEAYLGWSSTRGIDGLQNTNPHCSSVSGDMPFQKHTVNVIDLFWRKQMDINVEEGDYTTATALVRHGLIPVSPLYHSYAITTRTLELFRVTRLRCPQLSIEGFVKSLGDLQLTAPRSTLKTHFSIAYDVYEDILLKVDNQVREALGRNEVNYRIKHSCPCCMYELNDEANLIYRILFCMDGNDSLKRIFRSSPRSDDEVHDGPPESRERFDNRSDGSDYFLSREKVEMWAKERLADLVGDGPEDEGEPNFCEDRWENMKNDMVSRMWGIFEETGLFLALCRHGFVLVAADMIRSGELSKYPLAIVEHLLETLGADLGGGYDIGCKFGTTIKRTPVLGELAERLRYTSLVGLFHGHAHNRFCQTENLPTYRLGVGLEDFEGSEREFARTNAVAGVTRYATRFHRRRLIAALLARTDMDSYEQISLFLVNNYRQALELLMNKTALTVAMSEKGLESTDIFVQWLEAERKHLKDLKREPPEETLEMEYLEKLKLFEQYKNQLERARLEWTNLTPESISNRDYTRSMETARRHTQEKLDRVLDDVQVLEVRLQIPAAGRWTPESQEWEATQEKLRSRSYRRALDSLESLVIARLFELTKMNQSQTGYKLRKHIANALKSRSQAIRTALDKYNQAANEYTPPKPNLNWDQVVEYAFLADFDLLRESRTDIRQEKWAQPWARVLLDQYFKIQRAQEEIQRLNVEIRRLVTYIRDEDLELERQRIVWATKDTRIAFQIDRLRQRRARFNARHLDRLAKLSIEPGFTGTLVPGTRRSTVSPPIGPLPSLPARPLPPPSPSSTAPPQSPAPTPPPPPPAPTPPTFLLARPSPADALDDLDIDVAMEPLLLPPMERTPTPPPPSHHIRRDDTVQLGDDEDGGDDEDDDDEDEDDDDGRLQVESLAEQFELLARVSND